MAPGSSGLAPGIINQLLQQLWVNAGALKFNSLLYEVCCSLHDLNEASLSTNCTSIFFPPFFNKLWTHRDLCAYSTPPPLPSGTSKLKHMGAEKIKSSSSSVDPNVHTFHKQQTGSPSESIICWLDKKKSRFKMCWCSVQTCLDPSKVFIACNTPKYVLWVRTTLMNDYSVLNVHQNKNLKDYSWKKQLVKKAKCSQLTAFLLNIFVETGFAAFPLKKSCVDPFLAWVRQWH